MLPILLKLQTSAGLLVLTGYGLCVLLGVAAALGVALRRAREAGLPPRPLLRAFLPAVALGFVGARLGSWLQSGGVPFRGGLVLYGGLLAGAAVLWAGCRRQGLPAARVADLAAPCALLGAAFGRLGCFFAGCCYGSPADAGLCYPRASHAFRDHLARGWIDPAAGSSLPTVPMPLFEAGALLVLFVALSLVWARRRTTPGLTLCLAGLLYPAWRFAAEFWRGDNRPWAGTVWTFSQIVSLLLFTISALALLRGLRTGVPLLLPSPRAARVPWAAVALLLLAAAGVTCSAPAARPQPMAGEFVVRRRGCDHEEREEARRHAREETKEVADDCITDCIGDCISDCVDDCIEENCSCSGEGDPTSPAPAPVRVVKTSALRPGLYEGALGLEATVNGRLTIKLRAQGVLQVLERTADQAVEVRMIVNDMALEAGGSRLKGKGSVDLAIREGRGLTVLRSDLPPELLARLRALEPLLGDLLRFEISTPPEEAFRDDLLRELRHPELRVEGLGNLALAAGRDLPLRATAEVVRSDEGDLRVRWTLNR